MSARTLTEKAMALPIAERVALAQALWQSIVDGLPETDERTAELEAVRRDEELSCGAVSGRLHAEVMQAARRAIECA